MMASKRRRRIIWLSITGIVVLAVGFLLALGPPGLVDLVGYDELEPGVIEVALPCHSEVENHFTWRFDESVWVFAIGSDPQRYSFGEDDCLSGARINLGEPVGHRRLVDGFDVSSVSPLP